MLTPRENLLRILRHEIPERVPICGHVDPYNQPNRTGMDPGLAELLGDVQWRDEGTVNFCRWMGIEVLDHCGPPIRTRANNVTSESVQDGRDTITTWHTPAGRMRQVTRRATGVNASYNVEHMVNGPEDLPKLAALFEDETVEYSPAAHEALKTRHALIGEDGIIMLSHPGTPMGMMIRVYSGVETLTYLHTDAPDALADLFSVMEANYRKRFEISASVPEGDALTSMDDTSTTTQSPAMFERYCLGYTDRIAQVAHAAGKAYFHHSCGLVRDLLPLYRRTRMDCVHGYTIPPIGDVSVAQGREMLGDGIIIFAGLSQLFGSMDDRAAVAESIRGMFRGNAGSGAFILGLAGDPEKTMDDTQFVLDVCRERQHC